VDALGRPDSQSPTEAVVVNDVEDGVEGLSDAPDSRVARREAIGAERILSE
jgi:hypothetical protein